MNLESKARINSLISAANATTGKADTDLTSAVGALIAGFGQGGGCEVDHSVEDAILDGSIIEYFNDRVTIIRSSAFDGCAALVSVNFPEAVRLGGSAFDGCTSLKNVNLPKLNQFNSTNHFQSCTSLEFIKLPSIRSLNNNSFARCSNLKTVVLPQATLVALKTTNVFGSTPFASGGTGGTVYVPQALITEYQNATNWSTLYAAGTCNFVAIEGSEYE